MAQGQDELIEIAGLMKWFDPVRGFGFLVDSAGGPDVLLHGNVLRNFGQSTVAEGAEVRVQAIPTARGKQAVAVLSITPPSALNGAPIAELCGQQPEDLASLPFHPARVKWFDKAKGFGFANVFGQPADVFLHIEVLRHSGFADLTVGEAVALKVVDGRRGPMAALLASWDRGVLSAIGPPDHPTGEGCTHPAPHPQAPHPQAPHHGAGDHDGQDGDQSGNARQQDTRCDEASDDAGQNGSADLAGQPQLYAAARG